MNDFARALELTATLARVCSELSTTDRSDPVVRAALARIVGSEEFWELIKDAPLAYTDGTIRMGRIARTVGQVFEEAQAQIATNQVGRD